MAKQCATVVDNQGNIDSVILKNYDNITPLERAVKRNKGYSLDKASNGEPSLLYQFYTDEMNMSPEEAEFVVANTFSTEFGDWFGRWWEDGADASKVVDTNGQPKPVWSGQLAYSKFDGTYKGYEQNYIEDGYERFSRSAFFLENKYDALSYATAFSIQDEKTFKMFERHLPQGYHHEPVFLNIKNIKKIDSIGYETIIPLIPESKEKGIDGFEGKTTSAFGTQVNSWVISSGSQVIPLSEKEDLSDQMGVMLQNETGEKINTPVEIIEKVVDKLMDKNLVSKSYILSNDAIINKLKELGISDKIARELQVWHGSPHSFDKFSTSAMGTGEGAQAFGWGLYFTDLKSIAENYAEKLSKKTIPGKVYINGEVARNISLKGLGSEFASIEEIYDAYKGFSNFVEKSKTDSRYEFVNEKTYRKFVDATILHTGKLIEDIESIKNGTKEGTIEETPSYEENTPRNLYNVSLHQGKDPSEYTWLKWDKSTDKFTKDLLIDSYSVEKFDKFMGIPGIEDLSYDFQENSDGTYSVVDINMAQVGETYSTEDDAILAMMRLMVQESNLNGQQLYEGLKRLMGDKEASILLLKNGIDGVKYPAESYSRGTTSDNARGFNYVVFDENAITVNEIIQFNKELSNAGLRTIIGGFFNSVTKEVYLNEDSTDLLNSTLHEFSHPILQWLRDNRRGHFDAGIEVLKNNLKEAQPYIDKVKELYPNLKEDSDAFYEEVLATIIGNKGAELIRSKEDSNIQTWLSDLWKMFKDMMGLTEYSIEEVSNMSLQEFSDAINAEMFNSDGDMKDDTLLQIEQEKESIRENAEKDGTWMKAPNGQKSNLNEEQWITVRTSRFKEWFGDWESKGKYSELTESEINNEIEKNEKIRDEARNINTYETSDKNINDLNQALKGIFIKESSEIIDRNGEPMVFYHGSNNEFDEFDLKAKAINRVNNTEGFYFTSNKQLAKDKYGANTRGFFLNIKNLANRSRYTPSLSSIKMLEDYIKSEVSNDISYYGSKVERFKKTGESDVADSTLKREMFMNDGYDGLLDGSFEYGELVAFEPNQIKSAESNQGTYSNESNNINFQIEVQQNEFIPSQLFEELSQQPFMTKEQALDIYQHIYTEGLNEWKDNDMTC